MITRADLSWALKASIPHSDKVRSLVGLDMHRNALAVYSTDNYTAGIAYLDDPEARISCLLSPSEAVELERHVRPNKVAEHSESVTLYHSGTELHIAFGDANGVVFDVEPMRREWSHAVLAAKLTALATKPIEDEAFIFDPDLFARFGKAKRGPDDAMQVIPLLADQKHGVALVTIGESFVGGIAGFAYEKARVEVTDLMEMLAS